MPERAPNDPPLLYPAVPLYEGARIRLRPKTRGGYTRHYNVVYAEAEGVGLPLDVFVPPAPNGLGIVDVCSTAWHSGRMQIDEHTALGTYDALCAQGYTVFAVCCGSATRYTALEQATHVRAAVRFVKHHAPAFGLDAARLALMGASAGGHLASLAAVRPEAGRPSPRNPYAQYDTAVAAVVLYFAPSDLLDFGGHRFLVREVAGFPLPKLLFEDGRGSHAREAVDARLAELSPARQITGTPPPFLLWHGSADPLVPLSQSQKLQAALRAAGGHCELRIEEGGAHPWPSIGASVAASGEWLRAQLDVR